MSSLLLPREAAGSIVGASPATSPMAGKFTTNLNKQLTYFCELFVSTGPLLLLCFSNHAMR